MIRLCESTVIAGKYRLERLLASGGMGAVWVARHLQLDEPVAIKFMSVELPALAEARLRFAREARAAARLRSPHVVQVLDHGVDGDIPYIVMELLEGEHLGDRLRREGRLSLRDAAVLTAQIAKALGRAHRAGIIHRDLKPANVFLARVDDEEIVKVLDFGIAKSLVGSNVEATHSNVLIGSPLYMSPEQARSRRGIDHRSDLWSLGAILFRALTGSPLFEGASAVDVIVQICTAPLPIATHIVPDLPAEIDSFFERALERDPVCRFSSAQELSIALTTIAEKLGPLSPSTSGLRMRAPEPSEPSELEIGLPDRNAPTSRLGGAFPLDIPRLPGREPSAQAEPNPKRGENHEISSEIDEFVEKAFTTLIGTGSVRDPSPPPRDRNARASVVPESTVPNGRAAALRPRGASKERLLFTPASALATKHSPACPDHLEAQAPPVERPPHRSVPHRGTAVAALIEEGFTALRSGDREQAERSWLSALSLDPDNRMLRINLRRLSHPGGVPSLPLPRGQGKP